MGCSTGPTFYEFGMHYIRTDKIIAIRLGRPGEFSKKDDPEAWVVAILYDGSPNLKSITHSVETKGAALSIIKTLTNFLPLVPQEAEDEAPEII